MTNSNSTDPENTELDLDEIAEQFSHAIRNGDSPSVASYLARFPDASGQLEKLLNSVAMIEGLKKQTHLSNSKSGKAQLNLLPNIEGYQIVREIGRGGMGVVFEAIQHA